MNSESKNELTEEDNFGRMDMARDKQKITIICENKVAESLKRYFKFVCNDDAYDAFKTFALDDAEEEIREVLWESYKPRVFFVPLPPELYLAWLKEFDSDEIIFSQRLARHRIFFYHYLCDKSLQEFVKFLKDLC